jgi:hypothetical protein
MLLRHIRYSLSGAGAAPRAVESTRCHPTAQATAFGLSAADRGRRTSGGVEACSTPACMRHGVLTVLRTTAGIKQPDMNVPRLHQLFRSF